LLPTVYERLATGGGAFLAELRTVFPMFIRFGGIDFDADPEAAEKLDTFVRRVQHTLDAHGGNLLQLTLGDKGAYLYAVFGSPQAHGDEATRSVSAALELQGLAHHTAAEDIQIGISTGRVLSGTCGHPLRRTFACLGDPVNLAARLMGKAEPGKVLVTGAVVEGTADQFLWEDPIDLALKGKSAIVAAHALRGPSSRPVRRHQRYPLPMVGRERELALILERLGAALSGSRQVVGIKAEAGLGKSRLVAEIVRSLRAQGYRVVFGESQAFGTNTSYLAWREPWRALFELDGASEREQIRRIEATLGAIDTQRVRRAPLLSSVVGIEIPDNEVTRPFDPKLRKASLESLLADVLRFDVARRPLVLVLEDCHWIDEASLDLLGVLVRESKDLPLLIITAYRTEIAAGVRDRLLALDSFEEMVLEELTPADTEHVIAAKLAQQFGDDVSVAPEVIAEVAARGQGNPFYIEELVNFLRRRDVDLSDPAALTGLDMPESLQALVLRRVDALEDRPRRTLKVASVIGREFDVPSLPAAYPELGSPPEVTGHLGTLVDADLVTRSREHDESWLFRHTVTRDVAYESIPFQLRSRLHEAFADHVERRQPDAVDFHLDLLAHHYWHSTNLDKKIEYQRRAADAAKASYANTAAIQYYERLAEVVDDAERSAALRSLAEVLELVGHWGRAESVVREALGLAESAGDRGSVAWCHTALAEITRKQGRYEEATGLLDRAAGGFEELGDLAGQGRVLHLSGTLAAQRGDLDAARERYEASLEIREETEDRAGSASLLSNLGVVAEYSGDLAEARRYHERALAERTAVGDRWAIAVSNTNLGMIAVLQERHSDARDLFAEAMRLNEEVGDAWMVAVSHNNLGNAYRGLSDAATARHHYERSATAYRTYGDRWASAFLLEDVALLAAADGRGLLAVELLGCADGLRDEIETPRADALAEDLERRVVDADPAIPSAERKAARRRGRSRDLDAALDAVIGYCRGSGPPV
jgi:class 3 adenylate cyclase/tetratricopeptide (TPR) repeat protein